MKKLTTALIITALLAGFIIGKYHSRVSVIIECIGGQDERD